MSEPIRILRVLGSLDIGGIETNIMNMYRIIDRSKVQFDFILHCSKECTYSDEIRKLGGNIYFFPQYKGYNHIEYVKRWKDFFSEHPEYKVLHCHIRSTASIIIPLAKKYGLTTIAHSHSTSSGRGVKALFKNIYQLPIRYQADYLIACSEEAGLWLFGKKSVKSGNYRVIYNCINTGDYKFSEETRHMVRAQLQIPDNTYVIGHVGRFHEAKNHNFLIDLFKQIQFTHSDTLMLLIGDGKLKSVVEEKIRDYGLEQKIIITGERKDINKMLQAMDVFVFPSVFEGFGNAVIEAQASGLRCIESDQVPGSTVVIPELVERLSLTEDKDVWISKIMEKNRPLDRSECSYLIGERGFDVYKTTFWYQELYIQLNHFGTAVDITLNSWEKGEQG